MQMRRTIGMIALAACAVAAVAGWLTRSWWMPARFSRPAQGEPVPLAELPRGEVSAVSPEAQLGRIYWGDIGPLEFARRLSGTLGLNCIAFAPRPLDLAPFESGGVGSLQAALSLARRKFKGLESERHRTWMLLHFGTKEELKQVKLGDAGLPPLMVSAQSSCDMLRMIAEMWGLKLRVDPSLVERRDALLAAACRKARLGGRNGVVWGGSEYMYGYNEEEPTPGAQLTFSAMQRPTLKELMERAAVTLGGECEQRGDTWIIRRRVDGRQLAAQVDRLIGELSSEGLSEDSQAVQGLVAIGDAAVPKLLKALDPQQPDLVASAAQALAELNAAESVPRLLELWRKLKRSAGRASPEQAAARAILVSAMGKLSDTRAVNVLAKAATDADEPPSLRLEARRALVKLGALDALTIETGRSLAPLQERLRSDFRPAPPRRPAAGREAPTAPPPYAILARCRDARGQYWALFQCATLGCPEDLWLATSPDGKTWQTFAFSGVQVSAQAGYMGETGSGASRRRYDLKATQDSVILSLPNPENQRVTKRVKQGGVWRKTVTWEPGKPIVRSIRLEALFKDADHDGLTDLVEGRLGTNPRDPDSDGDGIPDDRDANPLAKPAAHAGDRQAILQLLFTYCFGGDPSHDLLAIHSSQALGQEFVGYGGPLIPLSDETSVWRVKRLARARVLHLGGPASSESTILAVDGPVCFNETRIKAEVHFWVSGLSDPDEYEGVGGLPDQVALFVKESAGWRPTQIGQWEWVSAGGY